MLARCSELSYCRISEFTAGQWNHSQVVGPWPVHAHHDRTRSSPLESGCPHCRSLPLRVPTSAPYGPRVLLSSLADARFVPSSFWFLLVLFSLSSANASLCFVARYAPCFPLTGCSRPSQRRHSRPSCRACVPTRWPASPLPRLPT